MKKKWLLFICVMMLCFSYCDFALADEVDSGTCGDNLTWVLNTDGTLTISGTGAMYDYTGGKSPWWDYLESINQVTIENGVTHIGTYSFFGCEWLTDLSLSDTVTTIGAYAFNICAFRSITFPASITQLDFYSFAECMALTEVTFKGSFPTISSGAFDGSGRGTVTVHYPVGDSSWNNAILSTDLAGMSVAWSVIITDDTDPSLIPDGLVQVANGDWYYYDNGTMMYNYTGIVDYNDGQFIVAKGILLDYYTGLIQLGSIWYLVSNGQVQTSYTGLAQYIGSWFYVTDGILDTTKNGLVPYDGETFLVADGQLLTEYNGLWQYASSIGGDDKWYFIAAGQVQNVSQVVMYDNEFFVVENGMLASDYNGTIEYDGATFTVVAGQLY